MKIYKLKIIFIVFLLIFLSGCSAFSTAVYDEKSVPPEMANYSDSDVLQRISEINQGATPKIAPNKKSPKLVKTPYNQPPPNTAVETQTKKSSVSLKELSRKYNAAIIETNYGEITIGFYINDAKLTVNNFLNLAADGFYDKTKFHRVIKGFMIQGGDPNSRDDDWSDDGTGGPGYKFADEINSHKMVRGVVAMANSGPDTNGSQFFILTAPNASNLEAKHTVFAHVLSGMETVDKIENLETNKQDHPLKDAIINSIKLIFQDDIDFKKEDKENKGVIIDPEAPARDASSSETEESDENSATNTPENINTKNSDSDAGNM